MGWAIVGLVLATSFGYLWCEAIFGGFEDRDEMERYEAQRAEFERIFE